MHSSRGISTLIGTVIFLSVLLLGFSALQLFVLKLDLFTNSFANTALLDEARMKEDIVIEKLSLGEMGSQNVTVSATSEGGGILYPVINMNFTDNADGWIFSAQFYNPAELIPPPVTLTHNDDDGDRDKNDDKELKEEHRGDDHDDHDDDHDEHGGDDHDDDHDEHGNGIMPSSTVNGDWSDDTLPSYSGKGSIYSYFGLVGRPNELGGALLRWTHAFTLDTDTVAAIEDASFSIGYYIPVAERVKGPAEDGRAVIFYTITDPNGVIHTIEIEEEKDELYWNIKEIPVSRIKPPLNWVAGEYKLQITTMVNLQAREPSDKKYAEFKIFFDDVGLKLRLESASAQSVMLSSYDEAYFTERFNIGSSDTLKMLDISIDSSSSIEAEQYIFLYDFTSSKWTLISGSTISPSISNVRVIKESLDLSRFVAPSNATYKVDPGIMEGAIVGDIWIRIIASAVSDTPFSYSATISLDTELMSNDSISFVLSNKGGIAVHIVRYYIVSGSDLSYFDSDIYLDPGESITISKAAEVSGRVEVRAVTERGSIASLTENI